MTPEQKVTLYVYATNGSDIPTGKAYEAKCAAVEYDNKTDSNNPVLIAQKDGSMIRMPVYRNIAYVNDEPVRLNGIVLFSGMNAFIPQKAADLLSE